MQAQVAGMGDIEHLNNRKAELQGELRANKVKISEYNVSNILLFLSP